MPKYFSKAGPLDWVFAVVVTLFTLLVVWMWAAPTFVPAMDYPAHLALTSALHHAGDTSTAIGRHFVPGTFPAPNSLFYIITYAASSIVDVDLAGRAFVAIAIAVFVIGFGYFAVSFGRSRWTVIASFPIAVQWVFTEGFLDYYLGIGLMLMALGAYRNHLRTPSRRRMVVLMLLGALVFLAHVQAMLLLGLGVLVLMVAADGVGASYRGRLVAAFKSGALAFAPAALLATVWFFGRQEDLSGVISNAPPTWASMSDKVHELLTHGLMVFDQPSQGLVMFSMLAVVILGRLVRPPVRPEDRGEPDAPSRPGVDVANFRLAWCLFLAFLAFYLVAPVSLGYYWNMHSRTIWVLYVAAIVAIVPLASALTPGYRIGLGMSWILPAVLAMVTWSSSLKRWNEFTHGLDDALASLPGEGRVLYVPEERGNTGFSSGVWRHLGQYHTAYNLGTTTFSFGFHPGRLVRERHPEIVAEFADVGALSNLQRFGCLDAVLHHGLTPLEERWPQKFRVIARFGAWATYSVPGHGCSVPVPV